MFHFFRSNLRSTPISPRYFRSSINRTIVKPNSIINPITTCIFLTGSALLTFCFQTAKALTVTPQPITPSTPAKPPTVTPQPITPPPTVTPPTIPKNKLQEPKDPTKQPVILISCGSFSPITIMHLRILEMAKDYYNERGFEVLGGYFSPVADSYAKKGLVPAEHRRRMIEIATDDSDWIMLDTWESLKPHWTETVKVLDHFYHEINDRLPEGSKPIKIQMICGSDLLDSFNKPGLWSEKDTLTICQYGIGVVARGEKGKDINKHPEEIIWSNDLLYSQRENIHIIHQYIPNDISSTGVRLALSRNLSVKYVIPEGVLKYIRENELYRNEKTTEGVIRNK